MGIRRKKIKESGPLRLACWTLDKPHNRATPEWLVSEDGPAQHHLDKNEAISKAHQLWLTLNMARTRSKAFFAMTSIVWTKVVNKPITFEPKQILFFFPLVISLRLLHLCVRLRRLITSIAAIYLQHHAVSTLTWILFLCPYNLHLTKYLWRYFCIISVVQLVDAVDNTGHSRGFNLSWSSNN